MRLPTTKLAAASVAEAAVGGQRMTPKGNRAPRPGRAVPARSDDRDETRIVSSGWSQRGHPISGRGAGHNRPSPPPTASSVDAVAPQVGAIPCA